MIGKYVDEIKQKLEKEKADQLYRNMLAEALKDTASYARQGVKQKQDVADTLVGGGMTRLKKGDVKSWNRNAARQARVDQATAENYFASLGMFDNRETATDPARSHLSSLTYKQGLLPVLQSELATSKEKDLAWKNGGEAAWYDFQTRQSAVQNKLAEMDAQGRNYYDIDTLEEADLLWLDKVVNGNAAWKPNYASQQDVDRYNSLVDQWSEIDWDEFDLAKHLGITAPEKYESKTGTLNDAVNLITGEIDRETELAAMQADIRSNPNYTAMSVYGGHEHVAGSLAEKYAPDHFYDQQYFMNNPETLPEYYTDNNLWTLDNIRGFMKNDPVSWGLVQSYLQFGYDMLTDAELYDYNAFITEKRYDDAKRYLELLGPELLARRADVLTSERETRAGHLGYGALDSVATFIEKPIGAVATMFGTLTGQSNPNSPVYDLTRGVNTTRTVYGDTLGDYASFEILGQPIGTLGYNILMSIGDMAVAKYAGGKLASAFGGKEQFAKNAMQFIMSTESATDTMYNDLERGFTTEQAFLHGVANGAIEAWTERGFMDSLFSPEGKFLPQVLKSAAAEGLEEIEAGSLQAVSDIFASYLSGRESEVETVYKQKVQEVGKDKAAMATLSHFAQQLALDGLAGFATGGAMQTGAETSQYVDNRSVGKQIKTNGDFNEIIDIASGMNPSTESYQLSQEAKERLGKGQNISLNMMGRIANAMSIDLGKERSQIINEVMEGAIAGRLVELGADEATAKANAPAVRKIANGEDLTAEEEKAVQWDDNASQVVKELASKNETKQERIEVEGAPAAEPEGQRTGQKWKTEMESKLDEKIGEVEKKQTGLMDALSTPVAEDVQKAVEAAEKKTSPKNAKEKNATNKGVAFATQEGESKGEFQRFEMKDGEVQVVVKSGETETTVKVEDLTDEGGAGTAAIIEYAATSKHKMTAEEANTMMQVYEKTGGNVKKFITDFEAVYAAGFAGIDAPTTGLSVAAATTVYEQAQREAAETEDKRVERAKALRVSTKGSVTWLGQVESNTAIRGEGDAEALSGAMESMTESQRSTVEVVQALADGLRVNIVLYEGLGKNLGNLGNGKYEPSTHTLYVDVNSGAASAKGIQAGKATNTLGYAMMRTLGHELTHHIESTSAEFYAQYKAAVKKQLQENGQSWAELVRGKIENAADEGRKLTRMGAEAEVVADASEYMLQESSFTKKLDSGLYAKVKTFVQSFMEKVREIFTHITGEHRESAALRNVIDGVKQYTGNLQELWDAALGETIQGEGALDEEAGDVTEAVEGAQFSMRDADVSYDALVSKPDMILPVLTDSIGARDRKAIASAGYKNAVDVGKPGISGMPSVYVADIGRYVHVSKKSLEHGLDRRTDQMSAAIQHAGELLQNAILINVASPKLNTANGSYILLSAGRNQDGTITPVSFVVNRFTNELEEFDVLKSMKTKKNQSRITAGIGANALLPTDSTISIAELVDLVKEDFTDIWSNDVIARIGLQRKATEITPYLQYSSRDLPDSVSIREYLGAMKPTSRMTETEKDLLGRYQKKLAELQEKESLAAEQDEIIKTAPATSQELLQAKNRYQVYRQQANRIARELARLERAEGFAGIMATSQRIVNEYLSGATGSVADAQDALETEIKGLTDRLKVIGNTVEGTAQGQRNAFARGLFNQAELNRAAKQLKDSYNSRMSVKTIADRLALAYGEIYANEGAEGAKRFAAAAKELAQDILDSSRYRYRSEILSTIAEEVPTISLTESDLQEIRNAGMTITEYKRGLSPYVKVVEGASDLSSYVTNAESYGGQIGNILGDDTEGNLAMALYNVIQAERASEATATLEGMSESASLGMVLADVASVNLPMSTSDTTLEYLRQELKKYAGENEQAAQSVDAAIRAAKTATARASAVWREAVKAQGIASKAVEYYRALEEQRRLIELQEQKEMLTEQLKSDAAKKLSEKASKMRQEYREREQKAREYRQTRDEVNKLRRGIGRKVKRLNALRIRETDQKHVPQELQHVADLVMQTFTESSLSKLAFAQQQTASLARRYRMLQELESDMTYYWDDEIEQDIDNLQALGEAYTALRKREGDVPSALSLEGVELETEILQGVDAIVSNVLRMIDSMNDQFLTQRNETFDAFATQTGEDLIHHDDAKILKGKAGDVQIAADEMLRTGNMTPIYFFEQLKNGRIMDVFNQIRRAQTEYARIIRECQDFVQGAKEKHHYGSWTGDAKLEMKTSQGHQITLSREQAMWVYATAKREKSNKLYQTEHLLVGGFQYKDTADTGEGKFRATDKPHSLDEADVAKISEWLTAEQKAYADEVVGFLSTTMADYGNAASMEMFGYKKFLESYYFPFQTAAAQRFQRGDEGASGDNAGTGRVKNSGFTKKLQHKANVTLVMDDFTTVAVDHMQKMATYAAMVQPIENMKRLMNHKVIEEDGTINTIRALIGQKYGMPAQKYLQDFLKDLNGAAQGDNRATKGVNYFINAFKRGAVMASASVTLQQPTAIARAMAMVSPKHFATNPFYRPSKGVWDEMMKHSGTAIIKDMGRFDVGLGLTASEYISDEHLKPWEAYQRLKTESKLKGGIAAYKRFMDWLTAAPGLADQWTWGLIWQAVKKEVAAKNPGMDTGSEAFLDMVGRRFDDVIDHTQVYDSVLTRSDLMRSSNALHKMATSFMSEPTLSINMLYNALTGEHSGKKRALIVGSVIASQILAGAMAALVQAWNDDDDERNWLEKYADRAAGNILDNVNPLSMIPYISDLMSLFEGYDVERPDMSVINDILTYGKTFITKAADPDKQLGWKDYENFIGTLANLTGLPAKNISREARRAWNAIKNTDWSAPNMANVGYAMMENVPFYSSNNSAWYERLAKAMLDGNAELTEDLRTYMLTSKMVKEDTIDGGVKTALKNLYADGKLDEAEAKRFLTDNGLVEDEDAAYWEVDKWDWMRETGGKAGDWRKYDDFATAVESGENLKQVIQTYLDNGVTAKTLAAKITEEYKPRMKELYKTNKKEFANLQARILTAYQVLGYDRDKKLKDIQKWLEED